MPHNQQITLKNTLTMFRFRKIMPLIGGLFLLSIMTGCNNENEFPKNLNTQHITLLSRTTEPITYKMSDWRWFTMPTGTTKWNEMDPSEWCGISAPGPGQIIFYNEKVWNALSLFSLSTGPTEFGMVWNAYLKAANKNDRLFIAVDFNLDIDNKKINIGKYTYDILKFEPEEIVVALTSKYSGGENGNGGKNWDWMYYTPAETVIIDDITDHGFESEIAAYEYILQCAREKFGDTIDLNEVYSPNVIYDYNIIDLNQLEEHLNWLKGIDNAK